MVAAPTATANADHRLQPQRRRCPPRSSAWVAVNSLTKTGNGHARRLLVEAAWHHRPPYRGPSAELRRRWDRAPAAAAARGHAANRRLHDRWAAFSTRKKRAVVANAAIARELAGWCWSLATLEEASTPG